MELQCPDCKRKGNLATFTSPKNAEVEALLDQVPTSLRDALVNYCQLFKPAKTALTPKKMARLIGELLPDIQRQAINVKSNQFAVPIAAWEWAFDRVLQFRDKGTVKPPLPNHNYLYVVITSYQAAPAANTPAPAVVPTASKPKKKRSLHAIEGMSDDEANQYIAKHLQFGESMQECFNRLIKAQEQGA